MKQSERLKNIHVHVLFEIVETWKSDWNELIILWDHENRAS
jgi:hypothetical protein